MAVALHPLARIWCGKKDLRYLGKLENVSLARIATEVVVTSISKLGTVSPVVLKVEGRLPDKSEAFQRRQQLDIPFTEEAGGLLGNEPLDESLMSAYLHVSRLVVAEESCVGEVEDDAVEFVGESRDVAVMLEASAKAKAKLAEKEKSPSPTNSILWLLLYGPIHLFLLLPSSLHHAPSPDWYPSSPVSTPSSGSGA
ncbi:hypothetical protein V2J09_010851 [Rumex salicifolius]